MDRVIGADGGGTPACGRGTADRAKRIVTSATINEDRNSEQMAELQQEVAR